MEASPAAQIVVRILEELIKETKSRARFVLLVIFVLLVAAVGVIAFAGQITSLDISAGAEATRFIQERDQIIARRDKNREDLRTARSEQIDAVATLQSFGFTIKTDAGSGRVDLDAAERDLANLGAFTGRANDGITGALQSEEMSRLRGIFLRIRANAALTDFARGDVDKQPTRAPEVEPVLIDRDAAVHPFAQKLLKETRIRDFRIGRLLEAEAEDATRLKEIKTTVDELEKNRLNTQLTQGSQDFNFLIASGVTRFGIVAIIVYIIQILVSLYRYNMRLSHFYASRLQAFMIGERKGREIDYYAGFFDAADVGFGKDVVSPTTEISDLIKKGFEEAGKVAARAGGKTG